MKNYRFVVEQSGRFHFSFVITATSSEEAVRIANKTLAESPESEHLSLPRPFHHAYFTLDEEFKVDASMIVEENPATHAMATKVVDYLKSQGYDYDLNSKDELWHDERPNFSKHLETMDGGIYAFLKVEAHYERNIKDWSFSISAFLYPTANASLVNGEGKAHYKVNFRDANLCTPFEELPIVLEIYENKFIELIYALREADPKDGLPL